MPRVLWIVFFLLPTCFGCVTSMRAGSALSEAGGNAALFAQFRAYDGNSASPLDFSDALARANRADVVLFGEEHSNAVCNAFQAQLFARMIESRGTVALAMEFFESDTQPVLDEYLATGSDESDFRKQTRQGRAYLLAHRPLIELARRAECPIIAANAPRRLVSGLRKSGLAYSDYVQSLPPEDRVLLPANSTAPRDAYWEAFCKVMESHGTDTAPASQPSSAPSVSASEAAADDDSLLYRGFRSQCLWDDAMAQSVAAHRARIGAPVMLIVGSFHVAHQGGTKTKFMAARPDDRVVTIVFRGTPDTALRFDERDRQAGDIIVYGVTPPEK